MKKYYAIMGCRNMEGVDVVIIDSLYSDKTPRKSAWQKRLNKWGSAPIIEKVIRADIFKSQYRIEGNYAFRK